MKMTITVTEDFSSFADVEKFTQCMKAVFAAAASLGAQIAAAPAAAARSSIPVPVPAAHSPAVAEAAATASDVPPSPQPPEAVAAPVQSVPAVASEPKPRGRPSNAAKAAKAEAAAPAAKLPAELPFAPAPEAQPAVASGPALSLDEFRAKLGGLAQEHGMAVNQIMPNVLVSDFGVTRVSEVPEGRRVEFLETMMTKLKAAA